MNVDLKLAAVYDKLLSEIKAVEQVRGEKGDQGEQGIQGPKGEQGDRGEQGSTGPEGKAGRDGVDGKDGKDGKDGVSVVDADIDIDGHLVLKLSDGSEIDAGAVEGLSSAGQSVYASVRAGGTTELPKWIDYVSNWSFTPTFLETITEGDVYEYTYENATLYRVVGSSPYTDKFYTNFANSAVDGFVISRGMSI